MALVAEMVTRFAADTSAYVEGIERAKQKNKEIAQSVLAAAGDVDRAIATINVARRQGALGDLGINPGQVSGVIGQLKAIDKELKGVQAEADKTFGKLKKGFGGSEDLVGGIQSIASGNLGGGIKQLLAGLDDLAETTGGQAGEKLKAAINSKFAGGAVKIGVGLMIADAALGALDAMAKKAVEIRNQFDEGKLSAAQMVMEVGKSIPVLGHIVSLGASINELITGEQAQLARIKAADDMILEVRAKTLKITQELKDTQAEWAKTAQAAAEKVRIAMMELAGDKLGATKLQIQFETRDGIADLQKKLKEEQKKIQDEISQATSGKNGDEDSMRSKVSALKQKAQDNGGQMLKEDYEALKTMEEQLKKIDELRIKANENKANQANFERTRADMIRLGQIKMAEADKQAAEEAAKKKQQADKEKAEAEKKIKEDADRIKDAQKKSAESMVEQAKSPFQKLADDIQKAVDLNNSGFMTDGQLGSVMQDKANDLLKQKADIEANAMGGKDLYSLPSQKEVRGGTLYAPPQAQADAKKLELLAKINEALAKLAEKGTSEGISLNVTQVTA